MTRRTTLRDTRLAAGRTTRRVLRTPRARRRLGYAEQTASSRARAVLRTRRVETPAPPRASPSPPCAARLHAARLHAALLEAQPTFRRARRRIRKAAKRQARVCCACQRQGAGFRCRYRGAKYYLCGVECQKTWWAARRT
jgi:hypothetical protein